ncbi:hypothetical protein BMWSH_4158 [Priestia megaterium WSH-002]|uniref:Uncharacterized protein n=1 Tax=Priestia megaterium (strain WSH-002) TaxID=1006007 RepID=A0A8D3X4N5_PRIMW|nr:hypothetical protein BMWSH_4158 [Priestia megaterium WSH-002]
MRSIGFSSICKKSTYLRKTDKHSEDKCVLNYSIGKQLIIEELVQGLADYSKVNKYKI